MAPTDLLTAGTWNIRRFGYDADRGHHRLADAVHWLLTQTPEPPDVLALPEARCGLDNGQRAIRRTVVHRLSRRLATGWYEPLFASRPLPGRRNHLHLLLVNTAKVRPLGWHDPHASDAAYRDHGTAVCEIGGQEVTIGCEHWSGGQGRAVFDESAQRLSTMGGDRKTLMLGDFNADSGWEHEYHHSLDWYRVCQDASALRKLDQKGWYNSESARWEIDTRQLDRLRSIYGYRDMGEEAGDPTPTTHPSTGACLRIDRIFRSHGLPAEVVNYYVRQPPLELSEHAYVFGTYRLLPSRPC